MIVAELVGGPKDGERWAIPELQGTIEFIAPLPPLLAQVTDSDTVGPIVARKIDYRHLVGNRYHFDATPTSVG
jgi:hypothetical protein